jgi:hypothetical protein
MDTRSTDAMYTDAEVIPSQNARTLSRITVTHYFSTFCGCTVCTRLEFHNAAKPGAAAYAGSW